MASQVQSYRAGAEVVHGDAICRKKSMELLEELGLPMGLLPMEDIQEFGYNRNTVRVKKIKQTTKELKLWLIVVEVYTPEASSEKVTFKTGTGLSDTFDAAAFAL
ncbi:uncharacterized protein [Miscanthus floridulus]|uniref:uncharacterized protein n=1 Tax=Miscanthus floridulus TaxID=154761 RepID=UPI003459C5BD